MYQLSNAATLQNGMLGHLNHLMASAEYSDMVLVVRNGKMFRLHKAIVASLLPSNVLGGSIHMKNVPEEVGLAMVHLIYTGRSILKTEEEVEQEWPDLVEFVQNLVKKVTTKFGHPPRSRRFGRSRKLSSFWRRSTLLPLTKVGDGHRKLYIRLDWFCSRNPDNQLELPLS